MTKLSDILRVAGSFEFDDKEYKIRPPNQIEQAQFSRWLERRAREAAARATEMEASAQDKLLSAAVMQAAIGVFEWGSDAYTLALTTPIGLAKMVEFILRAENPDKLITEDLTRRMIEKRLIDILRLVMMASEADEKTKKEILSQLGLDPNWLSSKRPSASSS